GVGKPPGEGGELGGGEGRGIGYVSSNPPQPRGAHARSTLARAPRPARGLPRRGHLTPRTQKDTVKETMMKAESAIKSAAASAANRVRNGVDAAEEKIDESVDMLSSRMAALE